MKLLHHRLHLKGLVDAGSMSRAQADKIMAAEHKTDRPRFEVLASSNDETEIKLYDAIDSWGGWWGISADEVAQALDEVETARIKLRINSPGGEVFEGIAIHNLFADHDADVHVVVDSLAASIASVIAMAGDRISMNRGAEMMIHNAWGGCVGDCNDMTKYADTLERQNRKAAGFYSARAGSATDEWLEAMAAETWYDADEAIEAGLADDKIALKVKDDEQGEMKWDLSIFNYAGRQSAPDPLIPEKTSASANADVDYTSKDAPDVSGEDSAASAADSAEARQRAAQVITRAKATLQIADSRVQ